MPRFEKDVVTGEVKELPDAPPSGVDPTPEELEAEALARFDDPVIRTMTENFLALIKNPGNAPATADDLVAQLKADHKAKGRA